jgi:hypothetical protein
VIDQYQCLYFKKKKLSKGQRRNSWRKSSYLEKFIKGKEDGLIEGGVNSLGRSSSSLEEWLYWSVGSM